MGLKSLKRPLGAPALAVTGILTAAVLLALINLVTVIPRFAPISASPVFVVLHEIRYLMVIGLVLITAYVYTSRTALITVLVFVLAYVPYFVNTGDIVRTLGNVAAALLGIWVMARLRASEVRLKTTVANAPIGIATVGPDAKILSANREYCRILGYSESELKSMTFKELIHPEDIKDSLAIAADIAVGRVSSLKTEKRYVKKDGTIIFGCVTVSALFDRHQKPSSYIIELQDNTQSKVSEVRINHLNAVLHAIRSVNKLITLEKNKEVLIQRSCDILVQRHGYNRAWILLLDSDGRYGSAVGSGPTDAFTEFFGQIKSGNYPACLKELLARDKQFIVYGQRTMRHTGCVLADEHSTGDVFRCKLQYQGKLFGVIGVSVPPGGASDKEDQGLFAELCGDVSFALFNIEGEEQRRRAEERYKTIVQTSIDGFWIVDPSGRIVEVNDAYCRLVGYSRDELLQMTISDVEAIENPEDTKKRIQKIIEKGTDRFETRHMGKDGQIFDVDISVTFLPQNCGQFIVTVRDITERKKAEKALLQSEENFRRSADDSPLGIRIINLEGETLFANRTFLNLYGYETLQEFRRIPAVERYTPRSYSEHMIRKEMRRRGERVPTNYEISIVTKDGKTRHLEVFRKEVLWDGAKRFQVLYHDVTELRFTREQLVAQDRLVSIGQLVSGVAHELNNPLTSILGFSELLLDKDIISPEIKTDLQIINSEAKRTSLIVRNLLTFARQQPQDKRLIDINEPINAVLQLRNHEQKVNNINVIARLCPNLPQVLGNGSQLQQVFLNIVTNAEYAMLEAHKKGVLTVNTGRIGNFVRASFADDGIGIPKENRARLFSPFFTTKAVGKGTGLGLSISQGIIAEHEGKIWVESEPGNGATFIVELPICKINDS